ncbi:MAG: hypothetical protein DCC65_05100 [Planctomycetota bacterium]|nr:MAG: hypothetical protein DCC65_05100 [Planctomycetota bacterium]
MSANRITFAFVAPRRVFFHGYAAMIACILSAPAAAQVRFQIVNANAGINGQACADEWTCTGFATPLTQPCAQVGFSPSVAGHEYGIQCWAHVKDWQNPPGPFCPNPPTFMESDILAHAFIDGDNTSQVLFEWRNLALSQSFDDTEFASSDITLNAAIDLQIVDPSAPPGSPVIVYYSWSAFGGASPEHDCPSFPVPPGHVACPPRLNMEDLACATNSLFVDGLEVLAGRFNLGSGILLEDCNLNPIPPIGCPAGIPGFNSKDDQSGVIWSAVGSQINISLLSAVEAHLRDPVRAGVPPHVGRSNAIFQGKLRITVGHPPPPPPPPPLNLQAAEFSVDIGSDMEMSDTLTPGGAQLFDPGDAYTWGGPPLACAENGVRDDAAIFGADPWPVPPVPAPGCLTVLTGAPVCSGIWNPSGYFDLDGHDNLDVSLAPALGANLGPIGVFPSQCITTTESLAVSFDDDGAEFYADPVCEIPTQSDSPNFSNIYGTLLGRDEVLAIDAMGLVSPPRAIPLGPYPIALESMVHPSLAPDPDFLNPAFDDDVDSLDMMADATVCDVFYFSCDNEAASFDPNTGNILDPGNIYQAVAGGSPLVVVDHALHMGLPDGVDIDAFHFAWLYNDRHNAVQLVLLFSVDDNDPITPEDESAGLDPSMVYASFLDGGYYEFFTSPLGEDIDAISTWRRESAPPQTMGACCLASGGCAVMTQANCVTVRNNVWRGAGTDCSDANQNGAPDVCECRFCKGDVNGDGQINGLDIRPFLDCLIAGIGPNCGCLDMDGNGTVNQADVELFAATLILGPLLPCP